MAIEIPRVAADRPPHPDWTPAAALARFNLPAGPLLAALESAGSPGALQDALRAMDPNTPVDILAAPERGVAQLLVDGRRLPLTGAARDAVLALLAEPGAATPRIAPAASPLATDAFLAARVAAVQAQVEESRTHPAGPPSTVEDIPVAQPAIVVAAPLLPGTGPEAAARALDRAVAVSGLFLEAHVAQWLRGERPLGQIHDEVDALARTPGGAGAADPQGRSQAQIDALQSQVVRVEAQAWAGQAMHLEIARDPDRSGADADDAVLFQATLRLTLPRLGLLQARIRLLHDTVALRIATDRVALVSHDLPGLASALAARGLRMAALDLMPAESLAAEAAR